MSKATAEFEAALRVSSDVEVVNVLAGRALVEARAGRPRESKSHASPGRLDRAEIYARECTHRRLLGAGIRSCRPIRQRHRMARTIFSGRGPSFSNALAM